MKTILMSANCEFIRFDGYQGVGWHIAAAEFPNESAESVLDARMKHEWQIGASLLDAVRQGRLRVRDCQTRFPLKPDAPSVEVLTSLVSLNDLREFVADLGYEVRVVAGAGVKDEACPQTRDSAPVVDEGVSDAPSNGKVWTTEKLAEASAYRKKYGTKKTAARYQVSESRIRQLLPGDMPKSKGYSAFTHRTK